MRVLYRQAFAGGELRWGVPSWVTGPDTGERTAKWLYWTPSGRPARTSPEPSAEICAELFLTNVAMGSIGPADAARVAQLCLTALPLELALEVIRPWLPTTAISS